MEQNGTQMQFVLEMLPGKSAAMLLLFSCSQSFTTCSQILYFLAQEQKTTTEEQQSLYRYSAGERGGSGVFVSVP